MKRKIRTLLFSTLYPSSVRPGHGIFVETRLRELLKSGEVETQVVAPVPWFPFVNARFGSYAQLAQIPLFELHNGIRVSHPRYVLLPKIGMTTVPLSLALGSLSTIWRMVQDGFDFDLIDAHYYYPDGVAAAILASWLDKPCVITARGSDLNLIPRYALPRHMIRWAAGRAQASIGVSSALVDVLRNLGVPADRVHVMRNGVDLDRFWPMPQTQARAALGIVGGPVLLSVGNLLPLKGHDIAIRMLAMLLEFYPQAALIIVGSGPEQRALSLLATQLGVESQVRFAGTHANDVLYLWYSAADILVLASSREGWPNVLLEAMACGTPVLATRVGGTPEIVANCDAACLVERRDPVAFALCVKTLLQKGINRTHVRAHAEKFSWVETTRAQVQLFQSLLTSKVE